MDEATSVSTARAGPAYGPKPKSEENEQPVVPQSPPRKVQWKRTDPKTNSVTASGWVVPKSEPYQRPDGTTCREVTQNVSKNGQTQSQNVTLCRTQVAQSDGSNWVIPE